MLHSKKGYIMMNKRDDVTENAIVCVVWPSGKN